MVKKALIAIALFFVATLASGAECTAKLNSKAQIAFVGSFSNMRYTEEHAYGYTVELWRSAGCLFGFLLSSSGLTGNTPTGLIENIKYDEKAGAISFSARLTEGLILSSPTDTSSFVPSHDIYEFNGTLQKGVMRGVLRHVIKNEPGDIPPIPSETVLLPLSNAESEMQNYRKYSQWDLMAKEILKARGPKW